MTHQRSQNETVEDSAALRTHGELQHYSPPSSAPPTLYTHAHVCAHSTGIHLHCLVFLGRGESDEYLYLMSTISNTNTYGDFPGTSLVTESGKYPCFIFLHWRDQFQSGPVFHLGLANWAVTIFPCSLFYLWHASLTF